MLTNEALDGVIAAIGAEFPDIPIYDERVEQGMPTPAFTVRSIRPRQALFRDRRYARGELIEVVYFPPEAAASERDTNDALDRLCRALEYITAGSDTLRGSDMDAHMDEESHVGVFTVNYKYFADEASEEEKPALTEVRLKGVRLK